MKALIFLVTGLITVGVGFVVYFATHNASTATATSTAASVGFQKGDIIMAVNSKKIARTGDLEKATREPSRVWRITLLRAGQQINVTLGG